MFKTKGILADRIYFLFSTGTHTLIIADYSPKLNTLAKKATGKARQRQIAPQGTLVVIGDHFSEDRGATSQRLAANKVKEE